MFHHLQKQQRAFVLCWNKFWFKKTRFYNWKIREIQDIYRILYQKNYNTTQALGIIEAEMEATPKRSSILLEIHRVGDERIF
jgi:acyl-[acyl carrier protein]--UDP-N-acetylglucosamine O-acyltransferase